MTDKPKRRWYQYSLRTLFVVMTLFAIACSWYAYEMHKAAKRRAAIEEIEKLTGEVDYYDASESSTLGEPPGWFSWLRRYYGDEHLGNALAVDLSYEQEVTDGWLANLKVLKNIEHLSLWNTHITDTGLDNLKGLATLKSLVLDGTHITDAGLIHMEGLRNLETLHLGNTQVTDNGLTHLEGLTRLRFLYLSGTQVTDEGVKKLQEALPNCEIFR